MIRVLHRHALVWVKLGACFSFLERRRGYIVPRVNLVVFTFLLKMTTRQAGPEEKVLTAPNSMSSSR